MKPFHLSVLALAITALAAWLSAPEAQAQSLVTTLSGCNTTKGVGSKSSCKACVKEKKRWKKSAGKGTWSCVDGASEGVAGDADDGRANTRTIAEHERGDAWPAPLKAMPAQQKDYVTIPAGTFRIGTPRKSETEYRRPSELDSKVTITRPFLMKTTEVTDGEFYFVMKRMPKRYQAGCLDCPALYMPWTDAIEYLNALSKLEKLEPCYTITKSTITWKGLDCTGYRLPTEAEWEYAGRGKKADPLYGEIDDIAWNQENSNLDGRSRRQPVGKKQPNAYGLYDMMGNAAELTWDEYREAAFENDSKDPIIGGLEVTDFEKPRTVRGSSFVGSRDYQTIAARYEGPSTGADTVGFRPVRTVKK